ncbi:hypothetical protein Hte_010941 [Hypoxylon texense]
MMENTQVSGQAANLRIVAKKLAKKPANQRQEKYRRLRQVVFKKYHSSTAKLPADPTKMLEERFQQLSIYPRTDPRHADVNLQTMLRVANDCYTLGAYNFDKMDLCEHMEYLVKEAKERGLLQVELPRAIVTRDLVVAAQHRKKSAEQDYGAFVAKLAALANLPKHIEPHFRSCKNCAQQFRFPAAPQPVQQFDGDRQPPRTYDGQCRYHPGNVRSWNDELFQKGVPLKEQFLTVGEVRMAEFNIMIYACYWDCCGAKLVVPAPDVAKKGKRRQNKNEQPQGWEITLRDDGSEGCMVLDHHIAS